MRVPFANQTFSIRACSLALCVITLSTIAAAQTTVTTGGGTTSVLPLFTGNATLGNSVITQLNSYIGINIPSNFSGPQAPLHIYRYSGGTAIGGQLVLDTDASAVGVSDAITFASGGPSVGGARAQLQMVVENYPYSGALLFQTLNGLGGPLAERMRLTGVGFLGIGTAAPSTPLEVNGSITMTNGSNGVLTFADGTHQNTAFIAANCGADFAESVDVSGDRTSYAPGDILVIDPENPGKFLKSDDSYSTMVAGIYSTQPGYVGRLHPRDATTDATEVPMAMVGRVPTKVSAENGPIHIGNLLVSSSRVGYAMKGTDRNKMLGAVLGKALGSLDSGTGVIQVLVTLQ